MIFVSDRKENVVGGKENADYKHYLLFLLSFLKELFSGSFKKAWRG